MKSLLLLTVALTPFLGSAYPQEGAGPATAAPTFRSREDRPLRVGEKLAEETLLRSIDGRQVAFKELRGHPVVFVFWSSMCPYTKRVNAKLGQFAKAYAKQGVLLIGVNSNVTEIGSELINANGMQKQAIEASYKARFPALVKHLKEKKILFPIVIDTKNKLADELGAKVTPQAFVFDKLGTLRYAGSIDDDPLGEKGLRAERVVEWMRDAVDAVLEDREVLVPLTETKGCTIKRFGQPLNGIVTPQR